MKTHEILDPSRPGRRSGIRRFLYRPATGCDAGQSTWNGHRSWSETKDLLRRTVNRAPEVVINVRGSRRVGASDAAANEGVLRYMMYISRNGRLLTMDECGTRLDGREAIQEAHASWALDMQRTRGSKAEPLHPSFNIILSMPARTAPELMFSAVRTFAQKHFASHQLLMALHTQETDPSSNPPEHPHVHLIVRAENENGLRIHIRKGTLRIWRESFAAELRAQGIDANATSRSERGLSLKARRSAEWHIQRRYEQSLREGKPVDPPKAKAARYRSAVQELRSGALGSKPWEAAMAARRCAVLDDLTQSVARLRQEGDVELAERVDQFMRDLPPLDTESRKIQRALVEQVQLRLKEHAREDPEGPSR